MFGRTADLDGIALCKARANHALASTVLLANHNGQLH
jgi:hypothetical protein